MPELKAQLSVKLDASALVGGLVTALTGHTADLNAISAPVSTDQLSGIGTALGGFDTGNIGAAVTRIVQTIPGQLAALPGAGDVLAPVSSAISVLESLTNGDLETQLHALLNELKDQVEGTRENGFLGILVGLSESLAGAPGGSELQRLFGEILRLLRVDLGPLPATGDVVAGVVGITSVLAGLMSLESVLGDKERLAGILARQLDVDRVNAEKDLVDVSLHYGSGTLAAWLTTIDVNDPNQVDQAREALRNAIERVQMLLRTASHAFAFGEATLVHLDVENTLPELTRALTLVQMDLDPATRIVAAGSERLRPFVAIDMSGAPTFSIDALLSQLESKIAEVTGMIDGFDLSAVTQPATSALDKVTRALHALTDALATISQDIRAALERVRQVIAALPFADIANAINTVLTPITHVLQLIQDLVAAVKAALQTAADAALAAITAAEGAIDEFKQQVENAFGEAKAFVEQLHIDQVVGAVSDKINEFAVVLEKAQLKPYFDTAVSAIGTAADVISMVPFSLLPESMKADVDAAVAPIKQTDASAVADEIEALLQIGPDGKFALRGDIETAIATVQAAYESLLSEVKKFDPHKYVAELNVKLQELSAKISSISPHITLQPIQDSIDQVKNALVGFDLSAQLDPVRNVFTEILAKMDEYSPAALIRPYEEKLDEARTKLLETVRFDSWEPAIDGVVTQALALLDVVDPERIEPRLRSALDQARALIDLIPDVKLGGSIGSLVSLLLSGTGLRIYSWSFDPVLDWIGGASGTTALEGRAARFADAITATRDAVRATDLRTFLSTMEQSAAQVRQVLAALPDSPARTELQELGERLHPEQLAGSILSNRDTYLAALEAAVTQAETVRRTGLSQVDVGAAGLRRTFAPLAVLTAPLHEALDHLGLRGSEGGVRGILRTLLDAAPPDRLIGIVMPIFNALRAKIEALLNALATPIKQGIAQLKAAIDVVDLTPLREAVDAIVTEAKNQVSSLSPDVLLHDPLTAFASLQSELATFDPLADVLTVLDALQAAVLRILAKLDAEQLLAAPLAIYDHIIGELDKLNVEHLLNPVLDELDKIATQVDQGLDETVTAFQQLQDALPSGGGGSSVSVSLAVA